MPDGAWAATLGSGEFYGQVALSPSGARAAVVKPNEERRGEIWVVDLATSSWTRLDPRVGGSHEPTSMLDPAWGPDGRRLAFTAQTGWRGFIRDLATGADRLIADPPQHYVVDDWTRDGSLVVFRSREEGARGVWVWAVAPDAPETHRVLWRSTAVVDQVQVSPDGRWVAYHAWDSGALEVYVARFPSFTDAQQVSASRGGVQPIWAHDGNRLFYLAFDGTMMGVDVRRDGESLATEAPRELFATRLTNPSSWVSEYDVTKDGRFLIIERAPGPHTLRMLMNWAQAGT
jgi:Tol biopolymer transport system component